MNKWFETTNFANYAKTALKEAQKRIDQVLDIKEEDIINNVLTQPSSLQQPVTNKQTTSISSENNEFFSEFLGQKDELKESTNSSLTLSNTSQEKTIKEEDQIKESYSPPEIQINEEKNNWIQNHWNNNEQESNKESENEQQLNDDVEDLEDEALDAQTKSQIIESKIEEFVTVNCNESQNSDEHETNFSSDIEVLSLPSSKAVVTPISTQNVSNHVIIVKSPPAASHESNILEQREAQILKLNKQNVQLQEQNDNFKSEIERLKMSIQEEISVQLREKNEQIDQLTQEGLKLSKNELAQSNIIKKLRAKEKENDETIKKLNEELKNSNNELEELRKILDAKESNEKLAEESIKKLEKTVLSFEKEIKALKIVNVELEDKLSSMKNALDNSYK